MKKSTGQIVNSSVRIVGWLFGGMVLGVMILYVGLRVVLKGRVYPAVQIGTVQLQGLSKDQAQQKMTELAAKYSIRLEYNGYSWQVPSDYLSFEIEESVNQAYRLGRQMEVAEIVSILLHRPQQVKAIVKVDEAKIDSWLDTIAQDVEIVPSVASVVIKGGKAVVTNGTDGTLLARDRIRAAIRTQAEGLGDEVVSVDTRTITNKLSSTELEQLEMRANKLSKGRLEIKIEDETEILQGERLVSLLATEPSPREVWDKDKINNYVVGLGETFDRPSQNAKFEVVDGKVKEFAPGRDGIKVEAVPTTERLTNGLNELLTDKTVAKIEAGLSHTSPEIATGDVNRLGITQRIGRGESDYAHSIPGRIHNVALTASRVTGALIPPGEEFSFNAVVGEISGATGYAPAYIIRNGRTELGDGGGVCQVSTTIFRAALNAGLPITERWAHAYRVGYYEQNSEPGIDATVFAPSKDLKFRNDTPGHILIQAINDPNNLHLVIEIYGTSDGRVAEVGKVKVWGQTAPPPDLYQDDPTMPLGKIKQVDWSAWGAKTTFDYKVSRNGEVIFEKSFPSTYRAWQNVYLRGTRPTP